MANILNPGGGGTPDKNVSSDLQNDPFVGMLEEALFDASGAVSSADQGIQARITEAIGSVQRGQEASAERVESQFERGAEGLIQDENRTTNRFFEGRRGFATNTAVLRQIKEDTDKSLKDLEQRKQELILQGESEAASSIAQLQLQALQFEQQARQQAFSNLLGLANFSQGRRESDRSFGLQERQVGLQEDEFKEGVRQFGVRQALDEKRFALSERQVDFAEEQAINEVALEFGLEVGENESLDSIVNKARPLASERQRLELDQLKATLANTRASTAKINKAMAESGVDGISPLTEAVMGGIASLSELTPTQRGDVLSELQQLGFSSDNPPSWFRTWAEESRLQNLSPEGLKNAWDDVRETAVLGKKFLNNQFFQSVLPTEDIKDRAKEQGVSTDEYFGQLNSIIDAYRNAGFDDKEILKLMQK